MRNAHLYFVLRNTKIQNTRVLGTKYQATKVMEDGG